MTLQFATNWSDGSENYFPHLIAQSLVSREHMGIPDHVNTIKTDLQVLEMTAFRNKYRNITGKGFAFPFGAKVPENGASYEIDPELLAKNDGFPDVKMFQDYFRLKEKRSQLAIRRLIHWAEVKY